MATDIVSISKKVFEAVNSSKFSCLAIRLYGLPRPEDCLNKVVTCEKEKQPGERNA